MHVVVRRLSVLSCLGLFFVAGCGATPEAPAPNTTTGTGAAGAFFDTVASGAITRTGATDAVPRTFRGEEFRLHACERGLVAYANKGPNTNGSQFFMMHADYPLPPNYVIFAKVTRGLGVVDALAATPTRMGPDGGMSQPLSPPVIKSVTIRR